MKEKNIKQRTKPAQHVGLVNDYIENLQAEYMEATGTKITVNAILLKALAKTKLKDIL